MSNRVLVLDAMVLLAVLERDEELQKRNMHIFRWSARACGVSPLYCLSYSRLT
jgi:hypothetical protein